MNHVVKVVKGFIESDIARLTTCVEEFFKWDFW